MRWFKREVAFRKEAKVHAVFTEGGQGGTKSWSKWKDTNTV